MASMALTDHCLTFPPVTQGSLQAYTEYENAMGTIEHMWSLPMGSQVGNPDAVI